MPEVDDSAGATPIRVLIADDSGMVRRLLGAIVEGDPACALVGAARDGREAIALAADLRPDVCLLDLEMPVMGGIQALPHLRAIADLEVVVVSSIAQPGSEERRTCLALGAAAVVGKPSGAVSPDLVERRGAEIRAAIRLAAGLRQPFPAPVDA